MTFAGAPHLPVEVPPPSTRPFDLARKLEDDGTIAAPDHVLPVDPAAPGAILWSHGAARPWTHDGIAGLAATVELPALGLVLPLPDLCRHVVFPSESGARPA